MSEIPLVILMGPPAEYLTKTELAEWLGLEADEVSKLVTKGRIPEGKRRHGRTRLYWTRQDAAVAKWIMDNQERFSGGESGEN